MIEALVMTACIKGSAAACDNATLAYYKYSGIESALTSKQLEYTSKYPVASALVAYTAMIYQQQATIAINRENYLQFDTKNNIMGYKFTF